MSEKEEDLEEFVWMLKEALKLPNMYVSYSNDRSVKKYAVMLNQGNYLIGQGHAEIDTMLSRIYGFYEAVNFMVCRFSVKGINNG